MGAAEEPDSIGAIVRKLRLGKGWSLRDVEQHSNELLKSGYLSQIENGKVQQPSLSTLRVIARTFGIEFRTLLGLMNVFEDDEVASLSPKETRR